MMRTTTHTFTLYDMIRRNAVIYPDKTAIIWKDLQVSFKDYLTEVNWLAASLSDQGVQPGDRIAVLAMNSLSYLVLYGAVSALGAILVPLNWRLSRDELTYILENSGAFLLFFDRAQSANARVLHGDGGRKFLLVAMDDDVVVAGLENGEEDDSALLKGSNGELIYRLHATLAPTTALGKTDSSRLERWQPFEACRQDAVFCLIYTAAVDGYPKGAALSHSNLIAANLQTAITMSLKPDDVYLNVVPLFHITGMNLALTVMHVGGCNIVMEKFDADQVISLTKSEGATVMASFPPILSTLTERLEQEDHSWRDMESLKYVVGIDSPENINAFTKDSDRQFWILYGQSETSGFVTLSNSNDVPGSAGAPCLTSTVAILDEADQALPPGERGEICVKGPIVFQGFWKGSPPTEGGDRSTEGADALISVGGTDWDGNSEKFDRSTIKNGWHHTGDVGYFDEKGYLWFQGRKPEKELIKPGGENVYPAEVESVLLSHDDVTHCCVIGVPDPKFGEGIKAVCVKKSASPLTEKALIEFVGSRIARYKKPGYVQFVDALPTTSDGAVDRLEVKLRYS